VARLAASRCRISIEACLTHTFVNLVFVAALLATTAWPPSPAPPPGTPAAGGTPAAPAAQVDRNATRTVGRLTLRRCETQAPWCATLSRPLDPSGKVPGAIAVYFEYYPHSGEGPAAGTLVGATGGPGYPTTGSADEYLALFAPLRERYDVVLMDDRGSGHSGAIDCRELQTAPALTEANIGACGRSLGASAPLYGSALAADDLAAILDELGIARVGLYGESYGSYFAQVFAKRHPEKLRALVLDGTYPLEGPDYGWYPHYAPAMRERLNRSCERAPACKALPGSSIEHITPALELLRKRPFTARVRYGDDEVMEFTADASQLAIVMFGDYPAYATVREVDAAARAFAGGDRAPLLRLMAETRVSTESRDRTRSAVIFSAGLAAAVFCQDAPQIFDMRLPPAQRRVQRDRLIAARKHGAPQAYAPFTMDEYRGMPLDYVFIDECVQWPASEDAPLVSGRGPYPQVPVLVVSGEFDNQTSVADGADAAAHYSHAHHVVIANSFHVNALPGARSACAAVLVRRFLDTLSAGDESCAAGVPPVDLVPRFARSARELTAAVASAGNGAGEEALRVVTAALLSCQDVIVRAREYGVGRGVGLRGGHFVATEAGEGYRLTLEQLRWTEDVSVSGQLDWPGQQGMVRAHLSLQAPHTDGTLELSWPEGVSGARATVRGMLGGRAVAAEAPAP
jgi:pimeloyl-ACP methyl ester carboxylesterase